MDIRKWWKKSLEGFSFLGPPDYVLIQKFAAIRNGLKEWRDEMKKKEGENYIRAMEEMEEIENCMESRDLSEEEEWSFLENKKLLLDIERSKASDLKQRARLKWAIDGDENSKFFHALVNARKAVNGIPGLFLGSGWVNKPSVVKLEVMKFFRSKFMEEVENRSSLECQGIKQLSESDKSSLIKPFSLLEVREALKECGDDKAPGPDGLNFKFIKTF
ncbi:uncharacterized protein LOC110892341 [Helianthus annuus]|uniref:uncharacterized protein LOC110892341 n=1 Tax=Helianthus annuus TaxID=4232 RepID=UPI000B909590|nr:uncharacterized protein LOC110892341 [Helianthus annuus]